MGICNLNASEQKRFDLTASVVTEKEALRDYIEQNGLLRPSSAIISKLESQIESLYTERPAQRTVDVYDSIGDVQTPDELRASIQSVIRRNNSKNSLDALQTISDKLGIPYEIISAERALEITNKSDRKGFYSAGKVYLVEGKFTSDTIFHEFAHPIVKSLAKENPALFEKLYADIDPAFIEGIAQEYKGLYNVASSEFREEVVVQALTLVNGTETPKTWLGRILYNLKQFLRGKFGKKINLKGLNGKTSLKDFVEMLNYGKEFELNMDFLSEDDFIYFENDFQKYNDMLNNSEEIQKELQILINDYSKMVKEHITALQSMKGYMDLQEGLVSKTTNNEILQIVNRSLDLLTTKNKAVKNDFTGGIIGLEPGILASKINAYVEQVIRIEKIVDVLANKIDYLKKQDLKKYENLEGLVSATNLLTQYSKFLTTANTVSGVYIEFNNNSNPLRNKVGAIINKIDSILTPARLLAVDVVVDTIYEHLNTVTEKGRFYYEKQLAILKANNSTLEYNRLHKEYYGLFPDELLELERLKKLKEINPLSNNENKAYAKLLNMRYNSENMTKDEFRDFVLSDYQTTTATSAWFNRMFESFMMNQDKAIGGFSSYITDKVNELKGNINSRQNELIGNDKLYDLLAKAGWGNKRHIGSHVLGKRLGALVDIGKFDSNTNTIESFNEWQYLSHFKNQDVYIKQLELIKEELETTYNRSLAINDRERLAEIEEKIFFHNMYFMNQDNTDQYYMVESLLYRDTAGRNARWAKADVFKKIKQLGTEMDAIANLEVAQERAKVFNELAQLGNKYYLNGTKKTGTELEIAETISEYQTLRREYNMYDWEVRSEFFQDAYNSMVEEIKEKVKGTSIAYDPNDEIQRGKFDAELDKWLQYNTTTKVSSPYYDMRSALVAERDGLMQPLMEANLLIIDLKPLYEELYELNKQTKDSSGQYDGILAEADKLKRIKEIHEKIEKASEELYFLSGKGLSKEQNAEFWALHRKDKQEGLTPSEQYLMEGYISDRKSAFSQYDIYKDDILRIEEINTILRSLTDTHYTSHYVDQWNELIDDNEDLRNEILLILKDTFPGSEDDDYDSLTEEHIQGLLMPKNIDALRKPRQFPEFNDWFELNHYTVDTIEKLTTGDWAPVKKYKPTSIWYKASPASMDYYEVFQLTDDNGNTLGIVKDKNGTPRVPNANYQVQTLKDVYRNDVTNDRDKVIANKLEIATRSNKDTWLPKSVDQRKKLAGVLIAMETGNPQASEQELQNYMTTNKYFNADGYAWDRYINHDYQNMFDNDINMFNLLDFSKNWHLDNQVELNPSQRIGLTYPKLRRDGIENRFTKGYLKRRVNRTLDNFRIREDDTETETYRLNSTDDDRLDSLDRPISGAYSGIDANEVSTDIFETSARYMYSVNEYMVYRNLNSLATTFQYAVTNLTQDKFIYTIEQKTKTITTFSGKEKEIARSVAINALIDKHFKGSQLARTARSSAGGEVVQKATASLITKTMRWSSRKWFMFNPISGLTNFASANIQAMYKLAYYDSFINPIDFFIGHKKAVSTLGEYTRKSYSAKGKSAQMQLMDILDASPDKYLKVIGDPGSRNILKDFYEGKVGYASRAYMTNEVNYMAMYALMNNKKHKFKVNGKKVTLDQVIELDKDGKIVTKQGTPQEWAITYDVKGKMTMGSEIKKLMNLHKGYLSKIHGMSGSWSEGDYDRYLLGKLVGFIFKFLPAMGMDRYGAKIKFDINNKNIGRKVQTKRRFNYNTQQYEFGTVIEATRLAQSIIEAPLTGFKKRAFLSEQVKGMTVLLITYFMSWILSFLRHGITFNADSERRKGKKDNRKWLGSTGRDEYTSLKGVSSIPDLPFVDPSRTVTDVDWADYGKLIGSRLLLRISRENATLMPGNLVGILKNQFTEPAALGGALDDIFQMTELLYNITLNKSTEDAVEESLSKGFIALVDDKEKDIVGQTSGPYIWQQKGAPKIIKIIANFYGFNGNVIDPYTAMKNEKSFYHEAANPWNLILGDPTYQPDEPYKLAD
jgi:hypothetical protein